MIIYSLFKRYIISIVISFVIAVLFGLVLINNIQLLTYLFLMWILISMILFLINDKLRFVKINFIKYPIIIMKRNRDNSISYLSINNYYKSLTGRNENDIINKTIYDVYPKHIANAFMNKFEEVDKTHKSIKFETILPTKNDIKIVNVIITGIINNNIINEYIVSIEDITCNRQETKNLEEISQRLNFALSLTKNIAVLEMNFKTKEVWASDLFFYLFELNDNIKGIISIEKFKEIFLSRKVITINDRYQSLDDLLNHNIKRLKCILPCKKVIYADYNVIKVNDFLYYLSIIDMTKKVLENKMLKEQIKHDSLTGLISRDLYKSEIMQIINKKPNNYGALYFLDMDNFKEINDTHGHTFGDKIIVHFTKLLKAILKEKKENDIEYVISRIAGDEFILYVHDMSIDNNKKIINIINKTSFNIFIDDLNVSISISVGIAIYNKDTENIDQLVEYADFAMYQAKNNRKNQIRLFDYNEYLHVSKINKISTNLDKIILNREFFHVYQPIIDVKNVNILGYEALSRPNNELNISIEELLDIATKNKKQKKLERELYFSILETFLSKKKLHRYIFINEGPYDIFEGDKQLMEKSVDLLKKGIKYVVEITEKRSYDENQIEKKIGSIKHTNGLVAVDDFGAGYSNDIALLSLEPDFIKIDRGLICNINIDERKKMLVSNIIRYANKKIKVIAEGVETYEELKTVINLGIDGVQGFYVGKPSNQLVELNDTIKNKINEIKNK